jgi:hypothetical protein
VGLLNGKLRKPKAVAQGRSNYAVKLTGPAVAPSMRPVFAVAMVDEVGDRHRAENVTRLRRGHKLCKHPAGVCGRWLCDRGARLRNANRSRGVHYLRARERDTCIARGCWEVCGAVEACSWRTLSSHQRVGQCLRFLQTAG